MLTDQRLADDQRGMPRQLDNVTLHNLLDEVDNMIVGVHYSFFVVVEGKRLTTGSSNWSGELV